MEYKDNTKYYSRCVCGAVTLYHRNGLSYACAQKNRNRFLPGLDLRSLRKLPNTYACDHCVNHYGVDLCACGSGEPFWTCENGLSECGQPMQVFGDRDKVVAADAWIA